MKPQAYNSVPATAVETPEPPSEVEYLLDCLRNTQSDIATEISMLEASMSAVLAHNTKSEEPPKGSTLAATCSLSAKLLESYNENIHLTNRLRELRLRCML